jgi:hypothetical protein
VALAYERLERLPGAPASEEAHDDRLGFLEGRDTAKQSGICCPNGREAVGQAFGYDPQAEDLRIGVREEEDHALSPAMALSLSMELSRAMELSPAMALGSEAVAMSARIASTSRWPSRRSARRSI